MVLLVLFEAAVDGGGRGGASGMVVEDVGCGSGGRGLGGGNCPVLDT